MNYKLKVLSPLHIGNGEKYSSLNYLIHERKMFCVELDSFITKLGEHRAENFAEWINSCSSEIDKLEGRKKTLKRCKNADSEIEVRKINNDLRKKRQEFTLKKFIENNKINLRHIIDDSMYSTEVQQGFYEDSEINPFIKQMNQPYVPGTEIKGSIRTAVLYYALLKDNTLSSWLNNQLNMFSKNYSGKIRDIKNNTRPDTKIKNYLVKEMAKIESQFQEKVLCSKPGDAKYDLMKYVQVGDSELSVASQSLTVSCVKPFNIRNTFSVWYEYMKPGTECVLSMLQLESEKSRVTKLENMGFSNQQKNFVSGMDAIFSSCCRFSSDLLDEEISFFSKHGKQAIVEQLKKIKILNTPESPVLRIGKDEGYNSLTVGLAVKKFAPGLYEDVLIHATKNKSYDSQHGGPFPKSRKIVYWNGNETTAGWVQIIQEQTNSVSRLDSEKRSDNLPRPEKQPANQADFSMLSTKFKVGRKK